MSDLASLPNTYDNLSKAYVKKHLKQYIEKPLQIGAAFFQIQKASEKWVTITESRKGLVQEHRRNTIDNILDYMMYKKTLFLKDADESASDIDPITQSKGYQTQHENFVEIKQEFQTHLEVIFKNYTKLINFNVDEENNTIVIKINHDQTITLVLPTSIDNIANLEMITISTNQENLQHIRNDISKFKCYQAIAALIYTSSKESIHFITTIKQLIAFKKQLKLLVSFVNATNSTEENFEVDEKREMIKNYLRRCKKGDEIILPYEDFVSNGVNFKREMVINKTTKIRTTVKVFAKSEDETVKHIEFARTFTKINQDLDKNTNEMYNLYIANI